MTIKDVLVPDQSSGDCSALTSMRDIGVAVRRVPSFMAAVWLKKTTITKA